MRPTICLRADAGAKPAGGAPSGAPVKPPAKPTPAQLRPKQQIEDFIAINAKVQPDHPASRQTVSSVEGIPEYELGRRAFISRPAKALTQAGNSKTAGWKITYQHEDRWRNPLMGWTSTRDPYTNLSLKFDTLEEAIEYAKEHNLKYQIEGGGGFDPQNIKPKNYGDKLMYKPPRKDIAD